MFQNYLKMKTSTNHDRNENEISNVIIVNQPEKETTMVKDIIH